MSAAAAAALVARAQRGERLSYPDEPPSGELAERMLAVPTELLLAARSRNAALAGLDLEGALARLRHQWLEVRGVKIHLEVQEVDPAAPSLIIVHGLGDHARRQLALGTALAESGYNVIAVDRQGHGISAGIRGDAPLSADLDVLEAAIASARRRWRGPLAVIGDSLGGILAWYALTREPDIDAAICHCIGHPDVHPDPSFRFRAPLIAALGRIVPQARVSVERIADYEHVALDLHTKRYFDDRLDRLFNFTVSARSASSYLGFRPAIAWEQVVTPALVLIGGADRLVTPEFTRAAFDEATPPHAEYVEIAAAGHQLFLDDLGLALPVLLEWIERTLAPAGAALASG